MSSHLFYVSFCWTLPTVLWNRFIFITWLYNSVYENKHVRRSPVFSGRKEIWIPPTWPQTENHPGTSALHIKPQQGFFSSLLTFNSYDTEELRNQLQPVNASKLCRNFFLLLRSGASWTLSFAATSTPDSTAPTRHPTARPQPWNLIPFLLTSVLLISVLLKILMLVVEQY